MGARETGGKKQDNVKMTVISVPTLGYFEHLGKWVSVRVFRSDFVSS